MINKRILIDCTDLILRNKNTGIQRVVKNLYLNFSIISDKQDFEVLPVYMRDGKVFYVNLEELPKEEIIATEQSSYLSCGSIIRRIAEKMLPCIPYKLIYFCHRKLLELRLGKNLIGKLLYFTDKDIIILADASWRMNIWKSLNAAKHNKAKLIPVIHDLIQINHKNLVRSCYTKIFTQWLIKLYKLSDCFICVSETTKSDLIKFYTSSNSNIQNKQFASFILGANLKSKDCNLSIISQDIIDLFKKQKSLYLIVSTIEPRKNHDYLLDVFDELWTDGLDIVLCIVGKDIGTAAKTVKRIKKHDQLNKKLFMFNNLNDDEVVYCYKNSKALLLPSIAEGFGLPIVESLNFSLPVLASDIPVFHEIAGENITYFNINSTVDLIQKIEKIENGELLLDKKVKFEQIHSWKDSVKQLLDIILKPESER
jgi:O-antigen biosynthesis alpha-1,2-rhamnosyltransferase